MDFTERRPEPRSTESAGNREGMPSPWWRPAVGASDTANQDGVDAVLLPSAGGSPAWSSCA